MSDEILKVVNKLYKQGDFQYVLGNLLINISGMEKLIKYQI